MRYFGNVMATASLLSSARVCTSWMTSSVPDSGNSLNRYEYVENHPVRLFDPNGEWGVEMHFAGVYWSGRLAGATHEEALKVALASQSLDDFEHTAAPDMKINAAQAPPTPS